MTEDTALLARIIDNPADDAPRLVYADWLDETGQCERAEFIRVQIELAKKYPGWSGVPADDTIAAKEPYAALARRERELWNASRLNGAPHPWIGTLGFRIRSNWLSSHDEPVMTIHPDGQRVELRLARGFPSHVSCPMAFWMAHGPAIVRAAPVERVTVTDKRPNLIRSRADRRCWQWDFEIAGVPPRTHDLPKTLWRAIAPFNPSRDHIDDYATYDTEAAAQDALSVVCLAWAKFA